MQNFTEFSSNDYLNVGIPKLYDDIVTVLSQSSGTAFPTTNLEVGMVCYRTDQRKAYRLTAMNDGSPVWKVCEADDYEPGYAEFDKNGNSITETYSKKMDEIFTIDAKGNIVLKGR